MQVGVLGGGQLGRMMAQAGIPLGITCQFYDPEKPTSTSCFSGGCYNSYDDVKALAAFQSKQDVMTLEWENVPLATMEFAASQGELFPQPNAVRVCQDRLLEKQTAQKLGIGTTRFAAVNNATELMHAIDELGAPGILKTRRLGYDGKGQWRINLASDIASLPNSLWQQELIYEILVPFAAEVSMISVRQKSGDTAFYPLIYNVHRSGVLAYSIASQEPWLKNLQKTATSFAASLLQEFNYVGVLVLEFFVTNTGELLLNEMAPRVHNSGHLTIEAAATSQFENHLRAILDWELGPTTIPKPAVMINLLGSIPKAFRTKRKADVIVHDYDKVAKPGRKVGHITIIGQSIEEALSRAREFDPSIQMVAPIFTRLAD